jgi:guanylate kinase
MNKPIIICIIGESGTGKTLIADYLADKYGFALIESHTTRPKRTPDEGGHTFVSQDVFNTYPLSEMIAYTRFGGYDYCCLKGDVQKWNLYVIDEFGFEYLTDKFSDIYDIFSIRLHRDKAKRTASVGAERVGRDEGKFLFKDNVFSWVINNHSDSVAYLFQEADRFMYMLAQVKDLEFNVE